jgi:AraC family transcriptional regulator
MPVNIQDRAPLRIAFLPHRGPYNQISQAFRPLYAWAGARGLVGPNANGVAVFLDDVRTTAPQDLRSEAGLTVGPDVEGDDEVAVREIPGGRYAVLPFRGPYAGLFAAWGELHGWMAQNGEAPTDAPGFEIYLNDPYDTAPEDLLTELCRPLG